LWTVSILLEMSFYYLMQKVSNNCGFIDLLEKLNIFLSWSLVANIITILYISVVHIFHNILPTATNIMAINSQLSFKCCVCIHIMCTIKVISSHYLTLKFLFTIPHLKKIMGIQTSGNDTWMYNVVKCDLVH